VNGKRASGFTLLEVLVAFIVLAVSLGAAFEVFSTGMRGERAAQSLTTATRLAQSRLAAVTAEDTLQEGETEGEDQAGYRWRVSVRPYILPDGEDDDIPNLPDAFVVTVSVGEIDGGPTATLTTLRLAPKSGDR
jgi:general secretion pathway protein I